MISAHEARELSKLSEKNISRLLNEIEVILKDAATAGGRHCDTTMISALRTDSVPTYVSNGSKPNSLQEAVIDKLKGLGYGVKWTRSDPSKAGRGFKSFGDDEEDDTLYSYYRIEISW